MLLKIIIVTMMSLVSLPSFSAFDGISHHSRANCAGFNETTTWWLGHIFEARVKSFHYPYGKRGSTESMHVLSTKRANTWRHIAYHATESYGGDYSVIGNHYMYSVGREKLVQSELVYDCDIYDGWWDRG